MQLQLKHVVIFWLFVTASCCENDGECEGKVGCPSGQVEACSHRQCTCKVGTDCLFDGDCDDVCNEDQTPDCRWWKCYCHND